MKTKTGLVLLLLIFSSQAMAEQGSNDLVHPYTALTGCSNIPPNGYVVTAAYPGNSSKNCGGNNIGGYLGYYVYESYFDKPVGTQIHMCQGAYPIPVGWYQVAVAPTTICFQGQAQALVIQRYS
ncbi:hypothetical protein ISP15_05685 [Dyella jejuensis]|uniref:Secreted protein n=1 Tax=Dyella jejuensis TaxID=1432009 RepID=A0ABW8JFF8_9GAMM